MSPDRPDAPRFVERADALEHLAHDLAPAPRLALDTEANSLHAFRERVCVVQLSVPGTDAIVDALAVGGLEPVRRLVDRPDVEVVMHGGDYDVSLLTRDHGFTFHRVFDTMIAATLLGDPKVGLQALLETTLGVVVTKKYQTADWAARPLSPEMIAYLRGDTHDLLALRDAFRARLEAADLVEESEIEFRRLAGRRGSPVVADPEAWRRAKGADRIDARARAVLHEVWGWREAKARAHDVPRFRVLHDEVLLAIATRPPEDLAGIGRVKGTAGVVRMGDAPGLWDAIDAGLRADAEGRAPPPTERPRLAAEAREFARRAKVRGDRLRDWRRAEALRRAVPNLVVLPNTALERIAANPPEDVAALAADPDVGGKRAARYGEAILALLHAAA